MDGPSLSETLKDEEVSLRPLFQIRSSFVALWSAAIFLMSTWMMLVVYLHSADASLYSTALWSQLGLFSGNASCVCVGQALAVCLYLFYSFFLYWQVPCNAANHTLLHRIISAISRSLASGSCDGAFLIFSPFRDRVRAAIFFITFFFTLV